MTTNQQRLSESIAERIKDYREGELPQQTPDDVARWIGQFPQESQEAILSEMDLVLARVYFSRRRCMTLFRQAVIAGLAQPSPRAFWQQANFLRIQKKGESQRLMLALFEEALREETGLTLDDCGSPTGPFFYLDDCIFTATHLRWDVADWVKSAHAPKTAKIHILALVVHEGRKDYTANHVQYTAKVVDKDIAIVKWWAHLALKDNTCAVETDCLQPNNFPANEDFVRHLLDSLTEQGHPAVSRTQPTTALNKVFSSETGRVVLEQAFLKVGTRIKYSLCPQLKQNHWPLGYDLFRSAGFGSLVVTYRNCPNNCPLALWASDPWLPLFPRKTNTQSAVDMALEVTQQSGPSGLELGGEEIAF